MKKVVFFLSLILSSETFSCSCTEFPTISEQHAEAEIVILATLRSTGQNKFGRAKFKWGITEVLKGEKPNSLEPVEQGLTSCDPKLQDGQEWLLFLKKGKDPVLGWCSFNRNTEYLEEGWRSTLAANH